MKSFVASKVLLKNNLNASFGSDGSEHFSSFSKDSYLYEVDRVLPLIQSYGINNRIINTSPEQ